MLSSICSHRFGWQAEHGHPPKTFSSDTFFLSGKQIKLHQHGKKKPPCFLLTPLRLPQSDKKLASQCQVSGITEMRLDSTFAWKQAGKKRKCPTAVPERKPPSLQLSVHRQCWKLTGFTISLTFTRSCMSYTEIQCSHATT